MCSFFQEDLATLFEMEKNENVDSTYARLLKAAFLLKKIDREGDEAALARLLDVTDQIVHNWKRRGVPRGRLVEIEEKIGASGAWVATGNGPMERLNGEISQDEWRLIREVRANKGLTYVALNNAEMRVILGYRAAPEAQKGIYDSLTRAFLGDEQKNTIIDKDQIAPEQVRVGSRR